MDIQTITDIVTTVGFPVVMCLLLYWQMLKSEESHKAEIDELRKTIENNTIALTQLIENLKGVGKSGKD